MANSSTALIAFDFLHLALSKRIQMKVVYSLICLFLTSAGLLAQVADEQVVQIDVTTGSDFLELELEEDPAFSGQYVVFRRLPGETEWKEIEVLTNGNRVYKDEAIEKGIGYEYAVEKRLSSQTVATGYVFAGIEKRAEAYKGGVILLIDSTVSDSLAVEIARLEDDLTREGWIPVQELAGRTESVADIKKRITDIYNSTSGINAMLILGHVAVPYSGNFTGSGTPPPDYHVEGSGNHTGAWAADVFYADLDGDWTDDTAEHSEAADERGNNQPGDGKYDQSKIPSAVELQVGRVDLANMPAFADSEIALLRKYLDRNHAFRTGTWKVQERALIHNTWNSGNFDFNPAATGYHNFSTMFPAADVHDDVDYFAGQVDSGGYLWSLACGFGYYTHCNGIKRGERARTVDFASETLENVFTSLAGSFFGDWDVNDNLLRAPLCNRSLVSIWGGLPKWYVHHMGLGMHIGHGVQITQDNNTDYFNGGFNFSHNSVHIALMGDPTLALHYLPRANDLKATSSNGNVDLEWTAAQGTFDGYNIYRIDSAGEYTLLNETPIAGTSFTDESNWTTGDYQYAVRTAELRTTPSGSYYSLGGGAMASVSHINSVEFPGVGGVQFSLYPNPAQQHLRLQFAQHTSVDYQVQVFHASGKQVLTNQLISSDESHDLDVSSLEAGSYFVVVSSDQGSKMVQPFMKR